MAAPAFVRTSPSTRTCPASMSARARSREGASPRSRTTASRRDVERATPVRISFLSQRNQRIHAAGAPRRKIAGGQRGQRKRQRRSREAWHIDGTESVEERRDG